MSLLWQEIFIRPLFNLLIVFYKLIPDMGVAIILLSILIRLLLLPSSLKALRAQKALQKLQPEIEKIRKKYPNDQQAQAQALMKFYAENKISPFSSCLPTLIQLPFLLALFVVFRYSLDEAHLSLLYPFIKAPEQIKTTFLGLINLAVPEKYVLPYLTGLLQLIQSKMALPKKIAPDDKQAQVSRQMMYFMVFITVLFALQLPAALPLFWLVSILFAIVAQYLVLREK